MYYTRTLFCDILSTAKLLTLWLHSTSAISSISTFEDNNIETFTHAKGTTIDPLLYECLGYMNETTERVRKRKVTKRAIS
jgi:hypothetical protein